MTLALAFGLPKDLDVGMIDPRRRLVGTKECKTSLQLVPTFKYEPGSSRVTVFLTKARAQSFADSGYEVALVNTALWRIISGKVKCSTLQIVGDIDQEDRPFDSKSQTERPLSENELQGWIGDMMFGGRLNDVGGDDIGEMMAALGGF